jgi:hypothetical protein
VFYERAIVMKCRCGNELFIGHQVSHHDVKVDGQKNFISDLGVYDSKTPFGPFTCTKCGAVYEEFEEKEVG